MIRVRQVKVKLNSSDELIRKSIANKLKINVNEIISFKINKQSIDARDKENVHYICEFDVKLKNEEKVLKYKSNDILLTPDEKYIFNVTGNIALKHRPVIVGAGPAGLYSAYMLAKYGFRPLIIERGEQVEKRVETVNEFWNTGKLNKNSNVQFGEGGAGTFSDGKLNTLVKDSFNRNKKVLEIFHECGAPEEILYINKPHIGTDLLIDVVKNLREKIISFGGEFKFNTCLTDIIVNNGKLEGIIINDSERIDTEILVLAIGHSAIHTVVAHHTANFSGAVDCTGVVAIDDGSVAVCYHATDLALITCGSNGTGIVAVRYNCLLSGSNHTAHIKATGNRSGVVAIGHSAHI